MRVVQGNLYGQSEKALRPRHVRQNADFGLSQNSIFVTFPYEEEALARGNT
jgi:hypothetical protein